jgi:hypothetical protein
MYSFYFIPGGLECLWKEILPGKKALKYNDNVTVAMIITLAPINILSH